MKLVNSKHFKYNGVWINYNKFSIGDKGIEHSIGCASCFVNIVRRYKTKI